MNIIVSSTCMKSSPVTETLLETECLFGEEVDILDAYLEWVYCKLSTDNYCGWIRKKDLGKLDKITHRVLNKRTYIFKEENEKSETLLYLPMGSLLSIKEIKSSWAKTNFYINERKRVGYVPIAHIVKPEHKVNDWVSRAQEMEGTPYRWGGRDTVGLDCSALLQIAYQTYGQIIPRNTSDQRQRAKRTLYPLGGELRNFRRQACEDRRRRNRHSFAFRRKRTET